MRCKFGGTPECKVHNWQEELQKLRQIVLACRLTEELKWGVPCYTYRNKNIALVSAFKEYCAVSFFKGTLLKDAHGFKTKAELSEYLSKNVQVEAGTFWGNGVNTTASMPSALQGLEPFATWMKLPPKTLIKPFRSAGQIRVIVAGGNIQTTWFVTDFMVNRGILIDDWK